MKLAIPEDLAEQLEPKIFAIAPDAHIVRYTNDGALLGDGSDVDVLLRWFVSIEAFGRLVGQLPHLRWLHIPRAGVDSTLLPEVVARDMLITNSAGVHAIPISEFVLLLMLSHAKRIADLFAAQANQAWVGGKLPLAELAGKTVVIIGMGQIGRAIAARAAAFGMHIVGSSRSGRPIAGVDQIVGDGEWRAWLPKADYVVVAAPLTAQTRGMIGAAELATMRSDSYLINIARGEIVDERALLAALRNGTIAGAALDVFETEPLPAAHPFWTEPNAFVTPHISWSSPSVRGRTLDLFFDNLRRYAANEPLVNIVDKEAGY